MIKKHTRPYVSSGIAGVVPVTWVECYFCGKTVSPYSRWKPIGLGDILKIMKQKGWSVAPLFKCPGCIKYERN